MSNQALKQERQGTITQKQVELAFKLIEQMEGRCKHNLDLASQQDLKILQSLLQRMVHTVNVSEWEWRVAKKREVARG